MAVLMTLDVAGGTTEQYDRMMEIAAIGGEGDAPADLLTHACGVTDDGIVIVEVWDSVSSHEEFAHDRLDAALAEAGMPEAERRTSPVHDLLFGAGTEPNVLVLLLAPGLTADAYDAITSRMPSHAGRGENHPAVVHVAAAEPDGFRIAGLWGSEAAYTEFVQSQLLPAVGDPRHFVLRIWPVHDCLRARRRAGA
jgi:hypothetical protein